jgi:hypothetical protein
LQSNKKNVEKVFDVNEDPSFRTYNFKYVEKDDLLERMMSFRSKNQMQEKKCEPQGFFPLKNYDELLWED